MDCSWNTVILLAFVCIAQQLSNFEAHWLKLHNLYLPPVDYCMLLLMHVNDMNRPWHPRQTP